MNKTLGIIIGVIVVIGLIFMSGIGTVNGLAVMREGIKQQEAEINNQLKRRADLIPNLVSTVSGLKNHEKSLIDSVTSARANMQQGSMQNRINANAEVSRAINVLVEAYPQMKSDTAFVGLMDELSGTENRITVARKNYNDSVGNFNKRIATFPTMIYAGMFGYSAADYLEVAEADKEVPKVEFN